MFRPVRNLVFFRVTTRICVVNSCHVSALTYFGKRGVTDGDTSLRGRRRQRRRCGGSAVDCDTASFSRTRCHWSWATVRAQLHGDDLDRSWYIYTCSHIQIQQSQIHYKYATPVEKGNPNKARILALIFKKHSKSWSTRNTARARHTHHH